MSVDPRVLRSEPFTEIGLIILRDAGTLVERWARRAVEDQPHARRVHHDALLDHLPAFLKALGRSLSESGEEEAFEHCRPAFQHGQQRWEAGWSLPEVVRDYQILRLEILDYLEENLDRPLGYREVMAVGLALDEAIAASVSQYVIYRDGHHQQQQQERLRREKETQEALRQQADALREADRRKNEFLATLAHELRNPLAPLRNAVGVLELHPTDDATVIQVRDLFRRQVQLMARLVDDLLDVSRVAQGKIDLRRERFDLAGVVAQAVQTCAPLVKARRHRLEVTAPGEPLWVEGDAARLAQVAVNLLNNAAKYTLPGGDLRVSVDREGGEAVLRVCDTGVGIPAELLPHVFDLFTQAEWPAERSEGGLGIGLTLVRRLVDLHGGRITAHSEGPGRGSEFVVRLPLSAEAGLPPPPPEEPAPAPVSRHVLIVEDNADGRESLEILLKLLGHRVEVAEDGVQGVEKLLALRPEIALIDIGLPRLDGYQVAERVRAELGTGVLLVALTGYAQPDDRRRIQEVGFDAHLVKPVELEALQRLIAAGKPA